MSIESIQYLEKGDIVTTADQVFAIWDGEQFVVTEFCGEVVLEGDPSLVVAKESRSPYVVIPDPKEVDYYAEGDYKGDIEREEAKDN